MAPADARRLAIIALPSGQRAGSMTSISGRPLHVHVSAIVI
jgi:hypothetical protein